MSPSVQFKWNWSWTSLVVYAGIAIGSGLMEPATAESAYFEGEGTAYTLSPPSSGNCNMMDYPSAAKTNYAALNDAQWNGLRNCGRCALVSCADPSCEGKDLATELVYIVDRCPECQYGDLDLSPEVFERVTGSSPSRLHVKWKFVDCPIEGNVRFCLKGGSNPFWTAIQPTNMVAGVRDMEINGQPTTMVDSAYYYLLDGKSETQADLSRVQVRITSVAGDVIEETVSLEEGECTEGAKQFRRGNPSSPEDNKEAPSSPAIGPNPSSTPSVTEQPAVRSESPSPAPLEIEGDADTITLMTLEPSEESTTPSSDGSSATTVSRMPDDSSAPTPNDDLRMRGSAPSDDADDVSTVSSNPPSLSQSPPPSERSSTPAPREEDATTQSSLRASGTSPMIILLACLAAVGTVALVVVAVMTRKKHVEEKQNDRRDDSQMMRAFEPLDTPSTGQQAGNSAA